MHPSGAAQSQRRKSSRTNSTSSSVVTVKKAASVSSRSGSRTPHSATRARSPDELGAQLAALLQSSFDPGAKGKRSSSWSRPGSSAGIKEGVGNLNRWSQSTTSSTSGKESGPGRKRKNSTSKHMSIGPLPMLEVDNFERSPNVQAGDIRPSSRRSPGEKLHRSDAPVMHALDANLRLPPTGDLSALSSASNPLETPSTGSASPLTAELLTPSTTPSDYFGEQWSSRQRAPSNGPRPATRSAPKTEIPKAQRSLPKVPPTPIDLATKPMPALPTESSTSDAEGRLRVWQAGHARSRAQDGTGSGDTDTGSLLSSTESERDPPQQRRSPAQKIMLSQALARANSAVLLDNAQEFRAAIEAYEDACQLLHQVMIRSSGNDERNKLQAIRTTYTNRVAEIVELEQAVARPRRAPVHDDYASDHGSFQSNDLDYEDETDFPNMLGQQQALKPADIPPRRQSLVPFGTDKMIDNIQSALHQPSIAASYYPSQSEIKTSFLTVRDSMRPEYMPPPLSPKRSLSSPSGSQPRSGQTSSTIHVASQLVQHHRDLSTESTSWLNTVDESGASSPSSLQSTSSIPYGAGNAQDSADSTDVDFELALDAAVNAAYDEPEGGYNEQDGSTSDDIMSMARRRNIALAKEMVREVERETARSEDHRLAQTMSSMNAVRQQPEDEDDEADYLDEEAEEEERLLEEMTRGYIMDDFEFNIQSKSALPRKSDSSSNFSSRTYGSSTGSTTITTGTSLSTLAESLPAPAKQTLPPPHPPPAGALPTLPPPSLLTPQAPTLASTPSSSRPLSFDKPIPGPGVRDRRLSGQNARQLKIETNTRRLSGASTTKPPAPPVSAPSIGAASSAAQGSDSVAPMPPAELDASTSTIVAPMPPPQTPLTSLHASDSVQNQSSATPASTLVESQVNEESGAAAVPPSPARFHSKPMPPPPTTIRKNFSSSSLRMRNMSVTAVETSDASPITPGSASFPPTKESSREALPPAPTLPTPTSGGFALYEQGEGPSHIFDDPIHVPRTPGTPSTVRHNAPVPLEACPESFLLRPFWLMRCLYQTVAHPRGGYLSTKLFIPRDIWRVKNVKLKAVDEKISQCDLLTAALQKLAKVDTLDADAVLEELQSFEVVMEQVRTALQKKLGNEVGVSGSAGLFKSASGTEEPQADPSVAKSSNVPGKSYLAGWRKLRSKSSGAGINASSAPHSSKDGPKESVTMSTLPMTAQPSSRFAKRNVQHVQQMQGTGPNASYMGALARLFDAVQVLDQIARQVEDPGLKCSSQTHVGLELSTRNAAEFFGFYICRFALSDIGLMLDKYVKRGSEWILI